MALTKVSGGILDPGINVAGIVTATGFDGPFTGGSGSNITAGIITATGFDLNGNGDISGNLVIGGNLTANGDFTTLNTTLREVEILRVDANTTAVAGIITQRGSGDIFSVYDTSTQVFKIADGGSVIVNNTTAAAGSYTYKLLTSDNISSSEQTFGVQYPGVVTYGLNAESNADFTIKKDGAERLRITSGGNVGINTSSVSIAGMSRYLSVSARNVNNGGAAVEIVGNRTGGDQTLGVINFVNNASNVAQITAKYQGSTTNGSLQFFTSGDERLRITSGGLVGIGTNSPSLMGGGNGVHIHDTGSTAELHLTTTASGKAGTDGLAIQMTGSVANLVNRETGYTRFYVGGGGSTNEKLRINNSGLVEIKNFSGVGLHLQGGSDTTLRISDTDGTNQRVDLAHNGGESYIVTRNNTNHGSFRLYSQNGSETLTRLRITSDGKLGLGEASPDFKFHSKETGGSSIAGLFETNQTDCFIAFQSSGSSASSTVRIGSLGNDLTAYVNGGYRFRITSAGNVEVNASGADQKRSIKIEGTNGSSELQGVVLESDGENAKFHIKTNAGGGTPTNKLTIETISGSVGIGTDAPQDALTLYDNDNNVGLYFQSPNTGNGGGDGFRIGRNDTHAFLWNYENQDIALATNGSERLAVTSEGITVTGEVAASQDYPNFRPTLDFNFAATKKLDPRITYQRTGPASFTDEFGKVVIVGDNVPRFDHDPTTRECKGLLIEESRTNLLSYSIPNSTWQVSQATITENAGIAPDGTNTAVLHSDNNTNNQHLLYTTATVSSGTNYVITSYLKQPSSNSRRYYSMTIHGLGYIIFDVQNGTVHNASGTGIIGATSTAVGNGWYRVKAHYVTNNTTGNIYWLPIADNGVDVVYTGASTAQGMLVWGCQLEAATFETSYIPTSGSTVTRGLDLTTVEGTDFSNAFGTEFKEFSFVADYDNTQTDDGTNYGIIDLWGESTGYDHRIEWFKDNSSPYHIETRAFGGGNALFNNGNLSASSKAKSQRFATSWSVPDYSNTSSRRFVVSMGGEAVDVIADNSGTTVPQLTRMGIGCNPTRQDLSGGLLHFKRLMVYNKTLSDGQLQNLSAQ